MSHGQLLIALTALPIINVSHFQDVRKDYESEGWKRHHVQGLEFEECDNKSLEAITLSIAGPKTDDDKWELEPVTPLKVRNFPPCFITAWHCVQFSLIAGVQ